MTSDISRQTFDSRKHYSKVVMQQGRVQLDADWNEQQDILQHRIEAQTSDMIGVSGASTSSNGFAVTYTPDHTDLIISPGYMYVNGILCELEEEEAIPVQSISKGNIKVHLANVDNPPSQPDTQAEPEHEDEQRPMFKKDHWVQLVSKDGHQVPEKLPERHGQRSPFFKITHVEIDQEKQVMLLSTGLSDFNVGEDVFVVRPITTYLTQPHYPQPNPLIANLQTPDKTENKYVVFLAYLDVWQRQITALDDPDIREVALGGADTAQRVQNLWQVKIMPIELTVRNNITEAGTLVEKIKEDTGNLPQNKRNELEREMSRLLRILTFMRPISHWKVPLPSYTEKPNPGRLSVRLAGDAGTYQGLENQLYRVEIDQEASKNNPTSTFKWARNNASSMVEADVSNGVVTIPGGGQGSLLGLKVGQYVELLDEQSELLGKPGTLAQITVVDDITGELTLNPPPTNLQHVRLRLWDGTGNIDGSKGTNKSKDGWLVLENGINIQFTLDTKEHTYSYKSGDYWLIPARTATGQIDWPHTTPQPPLGVEHYYARLACLLQTKSLPLVQDCRTHFFPLAANALHILDINWTNDIEEKHDLLYATRKLRIILDGEPDQQCARAMQAAMIVSVETALPGGAAGIFLISGVFNIDDNVITWHWHEEEKSGLIAKFFERFDDFYSDWFSEWFRDPLHRHEPRHHVRVRVVLKGHLIWHTNANGRRIYLDGQTFGIPGIEKSGYRPKPAERGKAEEERGQHIYLQFPSGTGRPASDFESWFYLKE